MGSQKDRYNYILQVIDDRLIPDDSAKKDRGEVFTPPDLVREMLFGLRKDKLEKGITEIWGIDINGEFIDEPESNRIGGFPNSVWRDPTLKWLDPANGIGNFPIIAFYKLDYELSKVDGYKNKDKRQQYIIEKMLYMIELDKGNCITCRQIFKKISPNAKPNILCANTLETNEEKLKKIFNIDRFDIIMGNPPFQEVNEAGETIAGKTKLYQKIIIYCLRLLNKGGYMNMVIPDNLFSGNSVSGYSDIIKKHVKFININNISRKHFPTIGQTTLYFILENIETNHDTLILDNEGHTSIITLENISLNPLLYWNSTTNNLFKNLICRDEDDCGLPFKYVREDMAGYSKSTTGYYKVIVNPDLIVSTNDNKKAHAVGLPKIIIFRLKNEPSYLDPKGDYGSGPETYYYTDKNITNLKNLKVFFDSKVFLCIRKLTTTSQYLKNPKFLNLKAFLDLDNNIEEKDIYNMLSIKESDIIKVLQHFDKPKVKNTRTKKVSSTPKSRYTHKTRKLRRR
jgi:hypothetical protein